MEDKATYGLGLIGCGTFGVFCSDAFSRMPDVRIAAVTDVNPEAAASAAKRFGCEALDDAAKLVNHPDVDIVHIATPPASHHELALTAIRADKHVLCEKPLALNLAQADEILAAARSADVICPVNFIMRYNAVADAAASVINSGLLGEALAGRLTNCAYDSHLPPEHWFWDKSVSGGIFIEHGVHFFDLYSYWLGSGKVISSHTEQRERTAQAPRQSSGQEDRVTCLVRHDNGAIASHYHGFDQISAMDRTDHRLVCELGDIRVFGWIPLTVEIDAAVDDRGAAALAELCGGQIEVLQRFEGSTEQSSRGKLRRITQRIRISSTPQPDKQTAYADSVQALLADQITYLRDRTHSRRIDESNGRNALAMGQAAAELARRENSNLSG